MTGFTLVRGGRAIVSDCDIFENGSEAFTVEDSQTMGTSHDLSNNFLDGTLGGGETSV